MSERQGVDWLIFGAHPDDAEIGMGGTIARFAMLGKKIVICDLTLAEMSSNGDPVTRQYEATAAASVLGIEKRLNLGLPDRGLYGTREHIDAITRVIRDAQPKIIFCPVNTDRHPDHVRTSELVAEAVLNARLRKVMPEIPVWTVDAVWQYHIHQWNDPKFFIDVTSSYDTKREALRCYATQFTPVSVNDGVDRVSTPINQKFLEQVESRDQLWGYRIGVTHAEAFTTNDPMIIFDF